jgi:ankyrin repeat protein
MTLDASSEDCLYLPSVTITSKSHCTQNENSEPLNVVPVGTSKVCLHSLHRSPDRDLRHLDDSLDLLPSQIDDFDFDKQFATRSSPPCFSYAIDIVAFDQPMQTLVSMKSSLQRTFESLQDCNPSLLGKILREWKKPMRQPVHSLQDVEAGETGELLKELPLNLAVIYRVMFLMVNNLDVLDRLKDGKDEHAFFRAGIRYIHSLPDAILNRFLDSIAPPFSYPLEQSLLCTAIELGANGTVVAILQRRRLDLENVACNISGQAYTLLERAVQLCHVEITSALLAYGLDPNICLTKLPIEIWAKLQAASDCEKEEEVANQGWIEDQGISQFEASGKEFDGITVDENIKTPRTTTTAPLKLFALLFEAGARLASDLLGNYIFSGQTLRFLLDTIDGPRSDWLIDSKLLSKVTHRSDGLLSYEDVTYITKSILNRDYSRKVQIHVELELTSALRGSIAYGYPSKELVEIFLSAGAKLDSGCLFQAVIRKQVEVVELLLSAGVTPTIACLSYAVTKNRVEVVKLLLSSGIIPDIACLSHAISGEHVEVVKALLCAGATPDHICLANALARDNMECVDLLLSAGAIPDSECLFQAVCHKNIKVVKALLTAGVTPDARCLPMAFTSGNTRLVKIFLSARTKPNVGCLLEAVNSRSVKLVEFLLSAGNLPDAQCLAVAAYHANLELVNILLSAGAIPDAKSLFEAVVGGCIKVTEHFLDLGVSANTMTCHGRTPLFEAIRRCRNAELQLFVSKGFLSIPSLSHANWCEALQVACIANNAEAVQLLLSAIQKDQSSLPNYLVKWMLHNNYQEVALKLVELGATPDPDMIVVAIVQRNAAFLQRCIYELGSLDSYKGMTLLYRAVHWGNLEVIEALVRAGVDLHEPGIHTNPLDEYSPLLRKGGYIHATPLVTSIWMGKTDVTNILLDSGALVLQKSKSYRHHMSPLTAAIIMRDSNLVRDLLQRGADPHDNFAIAVASFSQNVPLVKHLLGHFEQSYPMGRANFGTRALHEAIHRNNLPMLAVLAKHADGNGFLDKGDWYFSDMGDDSCSHSSITYLSPLAAAIASQSEDYIEMMRILLENKTNANSTVFQTPQEQRSAIIHAILNMRLAAVEILIKHGAELNIEAQTGVLRTPLQLAAELGAEDIVQLLLRYVDPNEPTAIYGGGTALQLASIKGHYRIAVLLLGRGADVNAAPAQMKGRTAFEGAAEHGRIDMMFLLMQHGVDLLANDEAQYKRAIRYSKANGQIGAMKLAEQMYEKATEKLQMEGILTPGLFLDESMIVSEPFDDWSTLTPAEWMTESFPSGPSL